MEKQNFKIEKLPFGKYKAEIFDLFTIREPKLTVVWLLNIISGDFKDCRIEYAYLADLSVTITSLNFKAVGIDISNLQAVLENSGLIVGKEVLVIVDLEGNRFDADIKATPIKATRGAKAPF